MTRTRDMVCVAVWHVPGAATYTLGDVGECCACGRLVALDAVSVPIVADPRASYGTPVIDVPPMAEWKVPIRSKDGGTRPACPACTSKPHLWQGYDPTPPETIMEKSFRLKVESMAPGETLCLDEDYARRFRKWLEGRKDRFTETIDPGQWFSCTFKKK